MTCETLEEFGNGELGDPQASLNVSTILLSLSWGGNSQHCVHDPRNQDKSTANLTIVNVARCHTFSRGVVRSP